MNTVTFKVEGMHCEGCAETIKGLLAVEAGVKALSVSFVSFKEGHACVLYDPVQTDESRLVAAIEKGGYKVASPA